MSDFRDQLRLAEYSSLRAELLQGKQFIFERPLLIIVAAGVATAQLANSDALILLPFALVGVLVFNLAFTVNRLQSIGRIIVYIEAVLESGANVEWIGWETALRKQRAWLAQRPAAEQSNILREHIDHDAIPKGWGGYYLDLLLLHWAGVIVAVAGSAYLLTQSPDGARIACFILAVLLAAIFAAACAGPFSPLRLRDMLESERAVLLEVLQSEDKVKLDPPPHSPA